MIISDWLRLLKHNHFIHLKFFSTINSQRDEYVLIWIYENHCRKAVCRRFS